jgi:nucleoside-diphosphate-sugar epimerase
MVYGDFADGVKEDAVCKPQGQYGIMKLMGEDLVKDYTRRGCFDHVIIRPSAVYGEYDVEDRVVSKFVLSALRGQPLRVNGANERLDFTHVSDTARGISQAVQSVSAINNTYNITFGTAHTLENAAHTVVSRVDGPRSETIISPRDINFPSRGSLDITAARQDFGYNPQVTLEQGLAQYIEWFRKDAYWKARI